MKQVKPFVTLIAALLVVATTTTIFAQHGPGQPPQGGQGVPGGPGGGPMRQAPRRSSEMFIIRMPSVQQHLNLTQSQITAINAIQPPQGGPGGGPGGPGGGPGGPGGGPGGPGGGPGGPGGGPGGPGGGPGGPGGPGGGPGGPGGGPGGPGGNQPQSPLAGILNETQKNRLRQLELQFDAPMTVMDPRVSRELQLTEQQRTQIGEIIRDTMPRPTPGSQPLTFAQHQARKAAAWNQVRNVLTQTQRTKWNQLTGPAFTNWEEPPRP